MTTDELRRSAMGPVQWYRRIARLTDEKLTLDPRTNTLAQPNYCHVMSNGHLGQVHLVPGGRYILVHADLPRIDLWDIGCPHMQPSRPVVLDSVATVDEKEITGFLAVSDPVIEGSQRLRFISRAQAARLDMMSAHTTPFFTYILTDCPTDFKCMRLDHFRQIVAFAY